MSYFNQTYNAAIRTIGLSGRLVLVVAMAKYLPEQEVGAYGLFQSGVMYAVYIVGFDFYAYATREYARQDGSISAKKIRSQLTLYVFTYVIAAPLLFMSLLTLKIGTALAAVGIAYVALEHLNQELVRTVEALGHPVLAGNLSILRSGVWPIVAVAALVLLPAARSLGTILWVWAVFGLVSSVISVFLVRRIIPLTRETGIDWGWMVRGLKVSAIFFIGTLCIRGIFTVDKVAINIVNSTQLPSYVLFTSIALAMLSIIESSVFAFFYPKMLRSSNNYQYIRSLVKSSTIQAIVVGSIISAICIFILPLLLNVIQSSSYRLHVDLAAPILACILIYVVGLGVHYGLYAIGNDRTIVVSHALGLLIFLLVGVVAGPLWGANGIIAAQTLAFASITLFKAVRFLSLTNRSPPVGMQS